MRHDDRVSFLVESGERWRELRAVHVVGRAQIVEDPDWAHVDALLDAKYLGYRTPRGDMPESARERYDSQRALVRVTPEGRLLTWDNARFETRS